MKYIEAPDEYEGGGAAVFLAGGITAAENWQARLAEALSPLNAVVLNPRRRAFPADNPTAARVQIEWEYRHLQRASLVAFWFPPPTLCPIALFELGACCSASTPLVVGADDQYARRYDLHVQLHLRRPEVELVDSLGELVAQIVAHPALYGSVR